MRNRAVRRIEAEPFLWQHMADDLADRLAYVTRPFESALIIGPLVNKASHILGMRDIAVTLAPTCSAEADFWGAQMVVEDLLPFATGQFDLVISAGTLDSVNDLPGALVQMRRLLKPDGLMLATLFGSGSLQKLKAALVLAEGDRASPHIHPQIDLRAASDLLTRTGFALPVADRDGIDVRYRDWRRLVADLRDHGIGNALANARHYPGKAILERLDTAWDALADANGRVVERFEFLHLSGWAPSETQPKPAKRGSATVSLADILSKPKD